MRSACSDDGRHARLRALGLAIRLAGCASHRRAARHSMQRASARRAPHLCGKVLQHAILADAVLQAQLRSKHKQQHRQHRRIACVSCCRRARVGVGLRACTPMRAAGAAPAPTLRQNSLPTWLPHCPTCRLMISRGMAAAACAQLSRARTGCCCCSCCAAACMCCLSLIKCHLSGPDHTTAVNTPCLASPGAQHSKPAGDQAAACCWNRVCGRGVTLLAQGGECCMSLIKRIPGPLRTASSFELR